MSNKSKTLKAKDLYLFPMIFEIFKKENFKNHRKEAYLFIVEKITKIKEGKLCHIT